MKDPNITATPDAIASPFAGSWYPGTRNELEIFLRRVVADDQTDPETIALILPHAGYLYSGETAGSAAAKVRNLNFKRVFLLAPSHRAYLENRICLPAAQAFSSPLGTVKTDTGAIGKLTRNPLFLQDDRIHRNEHSTQLEIPFLQYTLEAGFEIVPMIVGICTPETLAAAAAALKPLLTDKKTLVLASSDFTHYGPDYGYVPFKHDPKESLKALDMGAYHFIQEKSPSHFREYIEKTGATICGSYPIELLLNLLPKNAECQLTGYTTSGEITGDFTNSVSYAAIAFSGKWDSGTTEAKPVFESELTETDRQILLQLARASIARKFDPSRELPDTSRLSPAARRKMGAFVTLNIGDRLRGCIGEILPQRSLLKAVASRAVDAAFHDPRFLPLREDEFGLIRIEISALQPPHPVKSWHDIELGRHGILLQKDGTGAVFLPQVAPEQGWNLPETLTHLSMKAGLAPDAWQENAQFDIFEAQVFHE